MTGGPEPDDTQGAEGAGLGRRGFFRAFASGVVEAAGTAIGAADEFQHASIRAASAMLNPRPLAADRIACARPPFRVQDDVLLVVDENGLPDEVVEIECRSPIDLAREIARLALPGGSAAGEAAAISLALAASEMRAYEPTLRRAILEARAMALINARPSSQQLRAAVARMLRREEAESGAAMRSEAEAITAEAAEASRRIAERAFEILPDVTGRPIAILTHGGGVPLSVFEGHELLVYVTEGRPTLRGARVTTAELALARVDHVLIADAAAAWSLATGRVDALLVGAERIAVNGDVTNDVGTYPLAILAAHHGVPFYVCAPLASVDAESEGGLATPIEYRDASELAVIRGFRVASPDTAILNPGYDVTPHELITAIVTETGVLRPPFADALTVASQNT